MSSYPVLNNRPIDQWKVTELKDELRRRRLPVKGLKDDLVRRLDEALQSEIAEQEEKAVHESPEDLGVEETPAVADATVGTAPEEQNVSEDDEIPAVVDTEVSKETTVATVAITEGSQETVVPMMEDSREAVKSISEVSLEAVVAVAEVSEAPVADVAPTNEAPLTDSAPTKGEEELVSIPSDDVIAKEVHPQAKDNEEPVVEKTPEVDTSEKMVVDDELSDVTNTDAKSYVTSVEAKSDVTPGCKIEEETVSVPVDAVASDADPIYTDAVAAAPKNSDRENLVPKDDLSDNSLMYDEDCKDSKLTNEECKTILSEPDDQVPEVSPDLGSQIKCESVSTDKISINEKNNIKDNLNANNFDLELDVKPEMVKPSSSTPPVGGDLQPLDDDKELVKNQTALEEIDSAANLDSDKKEDSPEGGSAEKLNLDRSSGDESMEEDMMESKQVESKIRSNNHTGKTEICSEHVVKEVTLTDSFVEGSSIDAKEVVAEEKPAASTEKRKFEAQEVANNEPIKRQRRWNADNVKVPERQILNQSGSDVHKDVFEPALKRSFGRSDSTVSEDSPKERIVPPPQKPATTSLRIDRFVRPFTLKAVQELLGKTGSVCSFWMDHIKTHCYVTYSSVEEAVATRNAVYNLQWPPNNGNQLIAEFVDPQEVKLKVEAPPPSPAPISPSTATTAKAPPFQQAQANQTIPHQATTPREQLPPPPPLTRPPISDPGSARDRHPLTPKKPEPPVMTLDDLFRKTKASPRIYYLPLSEEEAAAKLAAQGKGKRE